MINANESRTLTIYLPLITGVCRKFSPALASIRVPNGGGFCTKAADAPEMKTPHGPSASMSQQHAERQRGNAMALCTTNFLSRQNLDRMGTALFPSLC